MMMVLVTVMVLMREQYQICGRPLVAYFDDEANQCEYGNWYSYCDWRLPAQRIRRNTASLIAADPPPFDCRPPSFFAGGPL